METASNGRGASRNRAGLDTGVDDVLGQNSRARGRVRPALPSSGRVQRHARRESFFNSRISVGGAGASMVIHRRHFSVRKVRGTGRLRQQLEAWCGSGVREPGPRRWTRPPQESIRPSRTWSPRRPRGDRPAVQPAARAVGSPARTVQAGADGHRPAWRRRANVDAAPIVGTRDEFTPCRSPGWRRGMAGAGEAKLWG